MKPMVCVVCSEEIPKFNACVVVDTENGLFSHCCCEGKLRQKVRVIKLSINGENWMGFNTNESCQGLLEEILELAKQMQLKEKIILMVEDVPLIDVVKWKEFSGW
jgi:hypothetical protein